MKFDRAMVESAYLRDILAEPEALEDTIAGLREAALPAPGRFDRIVLTGMGASFHALAPLQIRLVEQGFAVSAYETSELIHYYSAALTERTLAVIVSQSGRSAEIVRLLDLIGSGVETIGVTNTPDSPLATRAQFTLMTRAGSESSVSCKTFVTTLAALEWLGAALCGDDRREVESELAAAAQVVRGYLDGWEAKVAELIGILDGAKALFVIGRGGSMAAASAAGLTLKESAHFHAEGMTSAAFRHGPLEMCGPEVFVMVMEGEKKTADLNRRLAEDIRAAGGRVAMAGPESDVEALRIPAVERAIRPVMEMLPVQMTSLALAALGGHEPGKFRLLTKVTLAE